MSDVDAEYVQLAGIRGERAQAAPEENVSRTRELKRKHRRGRI